MKECIINFVNDFTKYPSGRYNSDGPFSGEKFREEFLVPKLKKCDKVIVNIDGIMGFGSSFLEEAFGGLIRKKYFTLKEIEDKLKLDYKDKSLETYEEEIWMYIKEAAKDNE
jgi:hypothetical protein